MLSRHSVSTTKQQMHILEIKTGGIKIKEKWEQAEIEIVKFDTEDVITTSSYHTPGENELPGIDPFA